MQHVDTVLFYVLSFTVLISILIFVHEWAHYYAARLLGIHATKFSVGMGPALLKRTDKRGCVWQIAMLPIGGYVQFLGDKDGRSMTPTAVAPDMPIEERSKYLHLRSPRDRAIVVAAGPLINLALGFAIMASIIYVNGRPYTAPVIGTVETGSPAAEAGFQAGDRIVSVDGDQITDFESLVRRTGMHPGSTFTMEVRRGDTLTTLTPTAKAERIEVMGVGQTIGRIGITSAGMVERIPVSVAEAGSLAAVSIYDMTISTFVGISQIVTGIRPLSDIGGPVRIAELSGNAASLGWLAFFTLMAFISANLGLVNLLPIPVLDGGHLMFCLYEAITRRPISERMVNVLSKVGATFLILILVGLTFSDVLGLAGRVMN